MRRIARFAVLFLTLLSLVLPCALLSLSAADENRTAAKEALLSALFEADIATLREAIDLRLITCHELTAYYLERIEAYNKTFNCFITLCDNALEEADKRDAALAEGTAHGSLFGIPIVVKDNIDYEGFHTTNGYKKTDDQIAADSAAIVSNLLNEGAVILGKTNMSTAAQEARTSKSKAVGETKNAYDVLLASGGSSGGSAVAMSLNFAAGSLGTDTNSSLRYPAALNGCVSLRPTSGLLSRDGLVILNKSRDTAGAITRTVADQAIMLDALVGGGNYFESLDANALQGLRIGVLKELSGPITSLSDRQPSMIDVEVIAAFNRAIEELKECGAEVVTVSLSKIYTMSNACKESKSGSAKAKETFYNAFATLLEEKNIRAVIFPTYLHTPQYTGVSDSGTLMVYEQNYINNSSILSPPTGLPEISIPIGTHSRGAGIGMEIASLKNSEQLLLDIAYSYTLRYDHRVIPSGAPDLYRDSHTTSLKSIIAAYLDPSYTETMPVTTVPETEALTTEAVTTLPETESVSSEATSTESVSTEATSTVGDTSEAITTSPETAPETDAIPDTDSSFATDPPPDTEADPDTDPNPNTDENAGTLPSDDDLPDGTRLIWYIVGLQAVLLLLIAIVLKLCQLNRRRRLE